MASVDARTARRWLLISTVRCAVEPRAYRGQMLVHLTVAPVVSTVVVLLWAEWVRWWVDPEVFRYGAVA